MRFNRAEAGGALGDLGVFVPLLAGMVHRCGLQLGPVLLLAGLMNVITGAIFRIPLPVQPMKAIAIVAIAEGLNEAQIMTAGIMTGAVILLLAVTGLIDWLNRVIPKSVVRGMQLALGLKLLTRGIEMIAGTNMLFGWDSIGIGVLCAVIVLLSYLSVRFPAALVVFGIGLSALLAGRPSLLHETTLGMSWHMPALGNVNDWLTGLTRGALPQIPLTTLNSVIAVCALSLDLFPKRPAAPRRVAISVALMNLVCCPFGGMPTCHGAGGLAAQHRFGARTGGSMVMLGVVKIVLALLLGGSLLVWLQNYPLSVLGVLLLFSGLELGLVCRDQNTRVNFFVMLITAGACMAVNTAVGFVIGWAMAMLLIWGVFRIEPPAQDGLGKT
ncbi:MAG: putative sulfate/molybdate transporter [Planctomycetota bacterium]|jgi:MFS superfamily sulfate permease-like transporter